MLSPSTSNKSAGTTTTPTSLDLNNAKTSNTSLTATATSNTKYELFNTSLKDLERIFNFKIVSFENRQQVKARNDNGSCKIKVGTDTEDSSIQRQQVSLQYTHQANHAQRRHSNHQIMNPVLPSSSQNHQAQTPRLAVPLTVLNELDSDLNSKFEKVQVEQRLKKRKFQFCNDQNVDQSLIELKKRHEDCHYSLFQSSTFQSRQQQPQSQQKQLKKQKFNDTFTNGQLPSSLSTLAKAPVTLPSSSSYSYAYNNHNGLLLMNNTCFMKELNNEFDENKLEVFNLQKEVIEPHYKLFYSSNL
ncbi:unnamed protein product [Ambrosiozyma monospora]|uniref:Unnamed protein product n=1 Tax=Ambrosiozyma monospora TaxID=43982 RepID=A0ACB5T5F4_AMBMO|nr:unnamed protein product [Ambrosiozyma monospora]